MDLDALFILLQPWLRPFLAFVFFTFLRYFYRAVLLRVLHRFNSKTSFEYGEDLLNAFEKAAQKLIDRRMVSYKGQRRAIKRCINSKKK